MEGESEISALGASGNGAVTARRILLPVDCSEHSQRAVCWYLENLWRRSDLVTLGFVIEPPQFVPGSTGGSTMAEDANKAFNEGLKEAKRLKEKFMLQLHKAGVPDSACAFEELLGVKPGETLVSFVKNREFDIVVIGNRGMGKLKRTFIGSVSDQLLHNCGVPVVVCPGKKDKKEKEKEKEKEKDKTKEKSKDKNKSAEKSAMNNEK